MKTYKSLQNDASSSFVVKEDVIEYDDDDLESSTSGPSKNLADSSIQESEEDSKISCSHLSDTLWNFEHDNSESNDEGKRSDGRIICFMQNIICCFFFYFTSQGIAEETYYVNPLEEILNESLTGKLVLAYYRNKNELKTL